MRTKATTALLLAWILVGSGICQCLAAIPETLPSPSHDCGSEPAAPTGQTDAHCDSECAVTDALQARTETPVIRAFAYGIDIGPSSGLTCLFGESVGFRLTLATPEPASSSPPYILHSALLL